MAVAVRPDRQRISVTPLEHASRHGEQILFKAEIPESWGKRILDIQVHRAHRVAGRGRNDAVVAVRITKEKDDGRKGRGHAPVKFFPVKGAPPERMPEKLEALVNERFNHSSPLVRAFRASRFL